MVDPYVWLHLFKKVGGLGSILKFWMIHNVKDYDNVGLYGYREFCGIKTSFSFAEILMPKLELHASDRTFTLSGETLSGESNEFLSE